MADNRKMGFMLSAGGGRTGQLNNELNDFLKNNQEFADIINLSVYKGKRVIRPEDLEDVGQVVYPEDHLGEKHELRNDVSKRCRNGQTYEIYCLENETKVSYVMPVRSMAYEAGRYMEQVKAIRKSHKKKDYHDWGEYSSGFQRDDKLHPVITLVLYWSRKPWDGAGSRGTVPEAFWICWIFQKKKRKIWPLS